MSLTTTHNNAAPRRGTMTITRIGKQPYTVEKRYSHKPPTRMYGDEQPPIKQTIRKNKDKGSLRASKRSNTVPIKDQIKAASMALLALSASGVVAHNAGVKEAHKRKTRSRAVSVISKENLPSLEQDLAAVVKPAIKSPDTPSLKPVIEKPAEPFDFGGHKVPHDVDIALRQYAYVWGMDADYGFKVARQESSFKPDARNGNFYGLGQFNLNTAMETYANGPNPGFEHLEGPRPEDRIVVPNGPGRYKLNGITEKQFIELLNDPYFSANLIFKNARTKGRALLAHLQTEIPDLKSINHSELYCTHFCGLGGAKKIILAAYQDSDQSIGNFFSQKALERNPLLYHTKTIKREDPADKKKITDGTLLTVTEYYDRIVLEKGFGLDKTIFESDEAIAGRKPQGWRTQMTNISENTPAQQYSSLEVATLEAA